LSRGGFRRTSLRWRRLADTPWIGRKVQTLAFVVNNFDV